MRLNAFEALCAKAGKLKRAIGVFSWQDTLQQHDKLTSCSKKQDLSQGHWKNDANFIAGATVTSSNGSLCRQLDEQVRHLFEKRILSKLDWQMSYKCPTTSAFVQDCPSRIGHFQKRRRPCRHALSCPAQAVKEGRRAANPAEMQFLKAAAPL